MANDVFTKMSVELWKSYIVFTAIDVNNIGILFLFQPIRVSGKTGIPKDILGKGLTTAALKQLDRENDLVDKIEAKQQKGRENSNSDYSSSDDENDVDETMTLASRVSLLSVRNKHESKGKRYALKK